MAFVSSILVDGTKCSMRSTAMKFGQIFLHGSLRFWTDDEMLKQSLRERFLVPQEKRVNSTGEQDHEQ